MSHLFCVRCCIYCVLLLLCPLSVEACLLKVRTFELPPFAIKDAAGRWSGIDIEYTQLLLDEIGCQYQFIELPWSRSLEMMKVGKIDMMLNVTVTKSRSRVMHFLGPQRMETLILVTKKGLLPKITSWKQMEQLKMRLMRQRGTIMGSRFEQLMRDNTTLRKRMVHLTDRTVNLDMIKKGRTSGFFAEKVYMDYEFEKNPDYAMLQAHPLQINRTAVFYALSKASVDEALMKRLKEGYIRLRDNGRIQAVEGMYELY